MVGSKSETVNEFDASIFAPYRLVSPQGVPFTEEASGLGTFTWDRTDLDVEYRVPHLKYGNFVQELLGGIVFTAGSFQRIAPDRYFRFPWLYCKQASAFEGLGRAIAFGPHNQLVYPGGVRIRATYGSPDFDQEDEVSFGVPTTPDQEIQLSTLVLDYSAEYVTIPSDNFQYSNGTTTEQYKDAPVAIRVGSIQIQYTRHFVRDIPGATIDDLSGHVNSTTFAGFAAETVLFLGAQARRVLTTAGLKAWELTYLFKLRSVQTRTALAAGSDIRAAGIPAGWNRVWLKDVKGTPVNDWVKVLSVSGSLPIYPSAELRDLFDPLAA